MKAMNGHEGHLGLLKLKYNLKNKNK